ncbi:MAG TPA: J domain-containing protein, partial [Acidimicrobiales bacterium]
MATDYYELLGVTRHATDDEIKKAYRRLARELHPDLNPGDKSSEDRFKQVTVAYETLCDPERRRRYDMFGPEGVQAPTDPFSTMAGAGIGDLFDAFFGGASPFGGGRQRGYGGPPRGSDAELALDLSFEEAVFGVAKDVSLRANVTCGTCGGSGARPGTTPTRCGNCRGSGEVRRVRQSILGQMVTATPCHRCGGTGEEVASPCADCHGDGRRTEERTYSVDVPGG